MVGIGRLRYDIADHTVENIILFVVSNGHAWLTGSREKGPISRSQKNFLRVLWAAPERLGLCGKPAGILP